MRDVRPDPSDLAERDPAGDLWSRIPDACCHLRKVLPMERALEGFDAWITGRKRFHGGLRAGLDTIEVADGRIKINPLAGWSQERIEAAFALRDLPRHPLFDHGFPSIGCSPCTRRVLAHEDVRAGRWSGTEKTECGIHDRLARRAGAAGA